MNNKNRLDHDSQRDLDSQKLSHKMDMVKIILDFKIHTYFINESLNYGHNPHSDSSYLFIK